MTTSEVDGASEVTRPEISISTNIQAVTDEAINALLPDREVFQRGGEIVRVRRVEHDPPAGRVRREEGAPYVGVACKTWLRERTSIAADWWKADARSKGGWAPSLPPEWVVETMRARGSYPFPALVGVVEAPCLRADGTVVDAPGYDAASGLFYAPNRAYPPLPKRITRDDAVAAAGRILSCVSEFPWVADSDQSAWLAWVLTLVARHAIDGPVPMFAVRARVPGTGKSMLADVAGEIGLGRKPARAPATSDDAEVKKTMLAIAVEALPMFVYDNANGSFGSPSLSAAVTATEWRDRVLGESRTVSAPFRCALASTGNNTTFTGDLGRRIIPIDLDAGCESPEARTFQVPDLPRYVYDRAPGLHMDALIVVRAWTLAGRPQRAGAQLGSFEAWDRVVRASVCWLERDDPCAGRARVAEVDDEDKGRLRALLTTVRGAVGAETWTVSELIEKAGARAVCGAYLSPGLREAIMALDRRSDGERLHNTRTGHALRVMQGRVVSNLRLDRVGEVQGSALWRVVDVGGTEGTEGTEVSI